MSRKIRKAWGRPNQHINIYMSRKICKKRTALHCDNGVIRCDDVDIWWYLSGWWRDLDTSFSVQLIWDLYSFPNLLLSWSWHFISYQKSTRKIQLPLFSRKKARKQWRSPSSPSCTPEIHQCSPCDPALGAPPKKSRAGIYALHEAGKPGLQQHVFPVYLAWFEKSDEVIVCCGE